MLREKSSERRRRRRRRDNGERGEKSKKKERQTWQARPKLGIHQHALDVSRALSRRAEGRGEAVVVCFFRRRKKDEGEFVFLRRRCRCFFRETFESEKKLSHQERTFACPSPFFQTATAPQEEIRARRGEGGFGRSGLGCGRTKSSVFFLFSFTSERASSSTETEKKNSEERFFQLNASPSSTFSPLFFHFFLSLSLSKERESWSSRFRSPRPISSFSLSFFDASVSFFLLRFEDNPEKE